MQKVVTIDNTPSTKSASVWNICLKKFFPLILNVMDLRKIEQLQKGKSKLQIFFFQGIYVLFLNNKSLNLNKKERQQNNNNGSGKLHLSSNSLAKYLIYMKTIGKYFNKVFCTSTNLIFYLVYLIYIA